MKYQMKPTRLAIKTINRLKGKVTMIFITHQIPRGLAVDEEFSFGADQHTTKMEVMEEKR